MIALKLIAYVLCAYGFCNMIIFARGPFGIFEWWRSFSHRISDGFGDLFTCPMCLSTWCGLFFSAIDLWVVKTVNFTPFNIVFGDNSLWWLILLMDMGATSGIVWLIHQLEEMMERTGTYDPTDDNTNIDADVYD